MELNSFLVKLYNKDECIFQSPPRSISAAVAVYYTYIRRYFNSFDTNQEYFSGHFALNVYSDEWLLKMKRELGNDIELVNKLVLDINQTFQKGHLKIILIHESKQ